MVIWRLTQNEKPADKIQYGQALGRGLLKRGEELVVGLKLGQGLIDRLHRVDRIHVRHGAAELVDRGQVLGREQFFLLALSLIHI